MYYSTYYSRNFWCGDVGCGTTTAHGVTPYYGSEITQEGPVSLLDVGGCFLIQLSGGGEGGEMELFSFR